MPMVRKITSRVDEVEYNQLLSLAKERRVSMSALVRYSLLATLEQLQHEIGDLTK